MEVPTPALVPSIPPALVPSIPPCGQNSFLFLAAKGADTGSHENW